MLEIHRSILVIFQITTTNYCKHFSWFLLTFIIIDDSSIWLSSIAFHSILNEFLNIRVSIFEGQPNIASLRETAKKLKANSEAFKLNLELWFNVLFTKIEFNISEYIERVCERFKVNNNLKFGESVVRPNEFPYMVCRSIWIWI